MRRHRFDIFSFVTGLLFAGVGVAYLINGGRWRFDVGPWVWPALLLFGGAIVLLSTIRDERDTRVVAEPAPESAADLLAAAEIDQIEPIDPVI